MRQDERSKGVGGASDVEEGKGKGRRRHRGGRSGAQAGFGAAFGPQQMMQMLPLMMMMGGGMPGLGVFNLQIQLMTWMIETWVAYLAAMQEVFMQALERLQDINFLGGGDDEEGDEEW